MGDRGVEGLAGPLTLAHGGADFGAIKGNSYLSLAASRDRRRSVDKSLSESSAPVAGSIRPNTADPVAETRAAKPDKKMQNRDYLTDD